VVAGARNHLDLLLTGDWHDLAKVGVEGSNPFARSSRFSSKLSPPFSGPRKSLTAAGFSELGLVVRRRNVGANLSPNADFSPEPETWPIYSTSFFAHAFNRLVSFPIRKVGIPFAYRPPSKVLLNQLLQPQHWAAGITVRSCHSTDSLSLI